MKRSTLVVAAFAGATILGPAGAATAAPQAGTGLPLTPWEGTATDTAGLEVPSELPAGSGSAQSGSVTGFETTGSSGNGSFGVPNLDRLLFGGRILCGALGSALAVAGEAMMDCRNVPGN
ncbi:hypothetical protein ACWEVD_00240 [Nocardia thailandica]|uniref:Uncharacterized protein n=1 Tax=Nocardia thailandica TaxID=257275 RepID=A0ABW6PLP6_9NOCA|nr:hypothetical protein [Nocardia thailandica]